MYDHLHQIFITKNVVLCSEVHNNFKELSHTYDVAWHFVSQEEKPLPNMIQDLGDNQFPIFITFKKLLLMLDASLNGPCFFNRREEGSLKVKNWTCRSVSLIFHMINVLLTTMHQIRDIKVYCSYSRKIKNVDI